MVRDRPVSDRYLGARASRASRPTFGSWPPASEFIGFVAAAFLLMLPFVDAVVALDDVICPVSTRIRSDDHGHGHGGIVSGNKGAVASTHKF